MTSISERYRVQHRSQHFLCFHGAADHEPAKERRCPIRDSTFSDKGSPGAPTFTNVPSSFSKSQIGIQVDHGAHRIDDEVKAAGQFREVAGSLVA
jgi:hypothetical protein